MKIKDVMTINPIYLFPNTTTNEAAAMMRSLDVGFFPVGDGERLLGVVTDRDLALRVCGRSRIPCCTTVEQVMTPEVIYVYEDQQIERALKILCDSGLRRLIVLDRDKKMTGIVSSADLARINDDRSPADVLLEAAS